MRARGVLAAWTYGVLHVTDERSERLLQDFYWHTLKSYWPEERRFVETGYRSLPFAFAEVAPPSFAMREEWSLAQLIGYVRSWSATSRYAERHGGGSGCRPGGELEAGVGRSGGVAARELAAQHADRCKAVARWFRSSRSTAILRAVNVETVIQFRGQVECRRDACGPLGLVMSGHTAQRPQERVHFSFAGAAPADLPETLDDASVTRLSPESYRISSGARAWTVSARAVHLHREVAREFYQAVPSRPVRWTQRVFWRIVLALAATPAGRWVFGARSRR